MRRRVLPGLLAAALVLTGMTVPVRADFWLGGGESGTTETASEPRVSENWAEENEWGPAVSEILEAVKAEGIDGFRGRMLSPELAAVYAENWGAGMDGIEEEYLDEGIRIKAFVPPAVYGKL